MAARNVTQRGDHEPDGQTMSQGDRDEIATVSQVLGRDDRPHAGHDECKGPNELGHRSRPEITVVHMSLPRSGFAIRFFPAAASADENFTAPDCMAGLWSWQRELHRV